MNRNTATLTITEKKISFNARCHAKLDECKRIELLYHPVLHMIAIMPCDEETVNAIGWLTESGSRKGAISATMFCESVYSIMNWNRDFEFKFRGVTKERNGFKIMFFLLDEPRICPKRGLAEDNETISYVSPNAPFRYPDSWNFTIGLSPGIKRKRDYIINDISAEDINVTPAKVVNPLIGEIPSSEEIAAELEELIMSM